MKPKPKNPDTIVIQYTNRVWFSKTQPGKILRIEQEQSHYYKDSKSENDKAKNNRD